MGLFDNLATAKVQGGGRLPKALPGEAHYLVNIVEMFKAKMGGTQMVRFTLTCLKGLTADGNQMGDKCSFVLSGRNQYFHQEFKAYCLAMEGLQGEAGAAAIVNAIVPENNPQGLVGPAREGMAWKKFGGLVCGSDPETDEPSGVPGNYNGKVVLHLKVVESPRESNEVERNAEGKMIMIDDPDNPGEKVPKMVELEPYINLYVQGVGKVPPAEVAGYLTPEEQSRFFGTPEALQALVAEG